ncbi:hypothetical protein CK203_008167 [Vitis vinifera]|uniref:Uncharacterized protein n=1 Tax=Vitis vinifera TaxID=29760 RepID=A0A438KNF3_VITVI|nr:hypothetical protein CK203_008167 [Vitis vinifera]
MQRTLTTYRPLDDTYVINVRQQQQLQGRQSPMRRMDDIGDLPIYDPRSTNKKLYVSELLICFYTVPCLKAVWVEMKDKRILSVHRILQPQSLNNTQVDITILASTTSPIASVPQNLTRNNETVAYPVSKAD